MSLTNFTNVISATGRAAAGVGLILLVILTAPGWTAFAFLPDRNQARMLELLKSIVTWVSHLTRPSTTPPTPGESLRNRRRST